MCDPISIGAGVLGMVASQALAPSIPNIAPVAPEAPPAANEAKSPDLAKLKANNNKTGGLASPTGGVNASSASTLLTGASGVPDDQLALSKKTLLGQ